jgi:hypothetical protein
MYRREQSNNRSGSVNMHKALFASVCFILYLVCAPEVAATQIICIQPVPRTIKELVEKQKAGEISEEILRINIEYLLLKYCASTDEIITPSGVTSLGDGCEMKMGFRLNEFVYWAACEELQAPAPPSSFSSPTD